MALARLSGGTHGAPRRLVVSHPVVAAAVPGETCVCMNVAVALATAINMCMFDLLGFVMHECFPDYIHDHTIA